MTVRYGEPGSHILSEGSPLRVLTEATHTPEQFTDLIAMYETGADPPGWLLEKIEEWDSEPMQRIFPLAEKPSRRPRRFIVKDEQGISRGDCVKVIGSKMRAQPGFIVDEVVGVKIKIGQRMGDWADVECAEELWIIGSTGAV